MKLKISLIAAAAFLALSSCASKEETITAMPVAPLTPVVIGGTPLATPSPKAIAYKMIGSATAANVPIQVDGDGNVLSYPDPMDLKDAAPIQLQKGYLLDRRGVSANTRFLTFTYSEYSALQAPPSPAELKAAIIPDARVSEIIRLPITVSEALTDLNAVNAMLP